MSIELRCEGCGRPLRAPAEATGQRTQCPACGHDVYVPTPEAQIEELPLAPEDAADLEREAALQAERRRLERALAHEDASTAAKTSRSGGSGKRSPPRAGVSTEKLVRAFLAAMRDSDLTQANQWLTQIQRRHAEALEVVDRLAADQIPPSEMANVPPAVYQGFLKNLRSQL